MVIDSRDPRETGREYALRNIRQNIISLELEPGEVLSENELSSQLGISRTPVREALVELSRSRIVEVLPQRGSVVSLMDTAILKEAFFIRSTLESAAAGRAAEAQNEDILRQMEDSILMQELFARRSDLRFLEEDNNFHRLVFLAAGCLMSYEIVDSVMIHMDRLRMLLMKYVAPEKAPGKGSRRTVSEHRKILEAIRSGDAEAAQRIMQEHLKSRLQDPEDLKARYPQWFTGQEAASHAIQDNGKRRISR